MKTEAAELATDDQTGEEWKTGQVTIAEDGDDEPGLLVALPGLPPARARDGETRKQTWERFRREARAAGMTRKQSFAYATHEADRFHPHFPPPKIQPEPEPEPIAEPEPIEIPEPVEEIPAEIPPSLAPEPACNLAEIPEDWPVLPPNASLLVEVSWVQANRLRVKDGERVDLSKALSPAPSHSALSWLETAIAFPAKWADVTVRATQNQEDETGATRREKAAVDDIASLLDSTLEELSF